MSLREKAREALLWGAGFRVFRDVLQFAVMLVMVRLLQPADYGKAALTTSVLGFLGLFSGRQLVAFIVQERGETRIPLQHHFTAGALAQAGIFTVANLVAFLLRFSDTYRSVAPLLHVASLIFLIELPGELRARTLERALDFKRQRSLLAGGLALSSATGLALAFLGAGVWALVIPPLLLPVPYAVDLFLSGWRPTWELDRKAYRPAVSFASSRVSSGILNGTRDLFQNGLMVRVLSVSTLGLFSRAVGLGNQLCTSISSEFVNALYPVVTRQEPSSDGFRRASGLLLRGVTWLATPIALVLALLGEPLIRVVYGNKWLAVAPFLVAAMCETLVRATGYSVYMLLLGAQQHRKCLMQDALVLTGAFVIIPVMIPRGVPAFLFSMAALEGVGVLLMLTWLVRGRALGLRALAAAALPAAASALVAAAALRGVTGVLPETLPLWLRTGLLGGTFVLAYGLTLRTVFAPLLHDIVTCLPAGAALSRALRYPVRVESAEAA